MLKERTLTILEAAVREFIETGQPISSKYLHRQYNFGVKPATIRSELNILTDSGYLDQLHTSGGRVPTDRGYQFFVERLVEFQPSDKLENSKTKDWFNVGVNDFIDEISEELQLLGIGYRPENREIYKSGLDELVAALDFETKKDIFDVVNDFEMVDERIKEILNHLDGFTPKVFIGKSPITRSGHLSVMADRYNYANEDFILIAIGPKRMNYPKAIQLFKALHFK